MNKPQTPHQKALLQKFFQEIGSLAKERNTRRVKWIQKIGKGNMNENLSNPNSYVYSPYETEALNYLVNLYFALEKDPNPFFFNEAYAEFLRTKNHYVKNNTNVFPKRAKSVPLINSVLRKMRLYSKQLETNNLDNRRPSTPRLRKSSFDTFSDEEINTNDKISLPSLRQLRNNTRRRPTRRLQGIVKSSPNTPPPEEV